MRKFLINLSTASKAQVFQSYFPYKTTSLYSTIVFLVTEPTSGSGHKPSGPTVAILSSGGTGDGHHDDLAYNVSVQSFEQVFFFHTEYLKDGHAHLQAVVVTATQELLALLTTKDVTPTYDSCLTR